MVTPGQVQGEGRTPQSKEPASGPTSLVVEDLTGGLTPTDLANTLVGAGVTIFNVTFTGNETAAGAFSGGDGIIGFESGIVLSSGAISNVVGPNVYDSVTTDLGLAGDPDLSALSGFETFDATILEFDFVPDADVVVFQFFFSSDEYNEFVYSQYNDVFAFFVNGMNCAEVEGDPISINTINYGNPYGTEPNSNPELYINNDLSDGAGALDTEMDGLTKVLTCSASVNAGVANHMKLAIADASDHVYDSAVFISASSVTTERRPVILLPGLGGSMNWECFFLSDEDACQDDSKWQWLPIVGEDHYEGLIDRLYSVDYTLDNGLFNVFHYDWTEPLESNVARLRQRISEVKQNQDSEYVDLVGHSMGGLVARAYVQSNEYQNDVAHLVTLGSPHRGAAKAYPYWEGGNRYQSGEDELWQMGLDLIISYFKPPSPLVPDAILMGIIRTAASGVRDIMPTETYLFDEDLDPRAEDGMEHRNTNLASMNEGLDLLYGRTSLATFAIIDVPETTDRFIVRDRYLWEAPKWDDGAPVWARENEFWTTFGDGTVPAASAILSDPNVHVEYFDFDGEHKHSMMANAEDVITAVLAFLEISSAAPPTEPLIDTALAMYVNGPAEIEVTDPSGRVVSSTSRAANFEVEGQEYFSVSLGDYKLVMVGPVIEGDYQVKISGSAEGVFELGVFDSNYAPATDSGEWADSWDTLVTPTDDGAVSLFILPYTDSISDKSELLSESPIIEMPLYMGSSVVAGRVPPYSEVSIFDVTGDVLIGDGTADESGRFMIAVSPALVLGQRVYAVANGEPSLPVTVEAEYALYLPLVSAAIAQEPVSLSLPITANAYDGYEDPLFRISGDGNHNNWVGGDPSAILGWILTDAPIPPGAIIEDAYIRFRGFGTNGFATATIQAFAEDDAPAFLIGGSNKPSTRMLTAARVDWANTWSFVWQWFQTPDLSALVQEVVDRPGWSSGNNIGFQVRNEGGGTNWATPDFAAGPYSAGNPTGHSVTLYVTYSPP